MAPYSIRYGFSQHFNVPAPDAYLWCTDYEPTDLDLMGEAGKRSVTRISEDAIVLTDAVPGREGKLVTKRKLVRLYPHRLSWTSTHLSGPMKHSQFLYEIVSESMNSSHLDFTGLQVEYDDEAPAKIESLAGKLTKYDSEAWKRLATAMEKDLRRG